MYVSKTVECKANSMWFDSDEFCFNVFDDAFDLACFPFVPMFFLGNRYNISI